MLLFAFAPLLELEHTVGAGASQVAAVRNDSQPSRPAHDSSTCPACLLLHTHAWQPDANVVALRATERFEQVFAKVSRPVPLAPRDGFLSRAPPSAFA
jgi:hypothetical protein